MTRRQLNRQQSCVNGHSTYAQVPKLKPLSLMPVSTPSIIMVDAVLSTPCLLDTLASHHFADSLADLDNQMSVGADLAEAASTHHVIRGAGTADDSLCVQVLQ